MFSKACFGATNTTAQDWSKTLPAVQQPNERLEAALKDSTGLKELKISTALVRLDSVSFGTTLSEHSVRDRSMCLIPG